MTLGEELANLLLYCDIDETPWPSEWPLFDGDGEAHVRRCAAATILAMARGDLVVGIDGEAAEAFRRHLSQPFGGSSNATKT